MRLLASASSSPIGRRCVSTVLLLAYTVTAAGVPISLGTGSRKTSEPYPCLGGSCGCNTADACWRSCCCHSLGERLAWARARGIQPPAFALAKARAMGLDLAWVASSGTAHKGAQSCCTAHDRGTRACNSDQEAKTTTTNGDGRIVAWRALACRGQSLQWLAAVPTLILLRPELSQEFPLIVWLGPAPSEVAGGQAEDPAVPPPECA
jgi:hypothetical protein